MSNTEVTYFSNGLIKSSLDKNNGEYIDYWPNGNMHKKCTYINGESSGDETYFDQTGKIVYDNTNVNCTIQ